MGEKALKQEGFSVEKKAQMRSIRQDRSAVTPQSCFLSFGGYKAPVHDVSIFGCSVMVKPEELPQVQQYFKANITTECDVLFKEIPLQKMHVRWAQSERLADGQNGEIIIGLDIMNEPLNIELIKAHEAAHIAMEEQSAYARGVAQLPVAFKVFVYELRDFLATLKPKIDRIEEQKPLNDFHKELEFRKAVAESFAKYMNAALSPSYPLIPTLLTGMNQFELKWAMTFAREQMGPFLWGAPFAHRAYHKPRGYAGDYEMMNQLYRDEVVGKTLYDQCIHKYFVEDASGTAVRNRGQYLAKKIKELFQSTKPDQHLKLMSIASGPAKEQQIFLQNAGPFAGRNAEFMCVDQDEESLKHAHRQLHTIDRKIQSGFNFRFSNLAIRNIIAQGFPEKDYDMIYTAGLFDYFTEPIARRTAERMLDAVKPGGKIIIGNFCADNYKYGPFLELFLDWHLIYRTEADLMRVFDGLGSKMWVEKEPLGVNLFIIIQK
ncbi:class I SAM-dependent methyltransferase [Bdellovibrio sp. KM01]|uniref:class I SAM-dependent methyltransferase n=1 Tax=Bdellovibrio sp. KM01 TaxID=2748865 RepID=UPI0015E94C83|nr:class I SAM-dependent methyltransferase [Bdellovibrio sp. KM01]QLY26158.1 class I SAM-dependent methyltransferase [Bdellovibrio sp. KM01]